LHRREGAPVSSEIRFDEQVAATYDEDSADAFAAPLLDATVSLLADLAGGGRALELAIGTGRVALPLQQRGVEMHGIDNSPFMVAKLREKAGGEAVPVTIGDMATTKVGDDFALVYLVFNTIMNLTTQEEQVACFENAAAHLAPGGCFVIEVGVPDLRRLPPGERYQPFLVTPTRFGVDEYDVAQGLVSHHYWVGTRNQRVAIPFRYVWPSELDLMARLAGMTLRDRWADWDRAPFTSESSKHVSVWEKQ
jgi:SAM-dependent methyltransferase